MLDKPLFHLGGGWWLCYDPRQWVLNKADKLPREGVLSTAPSRLRARAFIASTRTVLLRVTQEKEIPLTTEAKTKLDALPSTFKAWHQRHRRRGDPVPESEAA